MVWRGEPARLHWVVYGERGCFDDPARFLASPAFRGWHSRMGYFVLSNALAPQVGRTWRRLRDGLQPG